MRRTCDNKLFPMEGQAWKGEMQEMASEVTSQEETCGEHEDEYSFWCESCDVPACRKCLTLKHQGCKLVLIEDKHKLREQQEANLLLLKKKLERYCEDSTINEENLACVRFLLEKLQSVGIKMLDYQTNVKAWITEAQKLLSDPIKSPSALSKVPELQDSEQKKSPVLEEFERMIQSRPSSLLVHMAAAYQVSEEDVDAFVAALQSRVEARQAEDPSCEEDLPAEGSKQSFLEAVDALTEGEVWVVSDATSAAAVQSVLQTTSVRPAKVEIASNNIPDEVLLKLKYCFDHDKKYPVEASETQPSFPDSPAPYSKSRASSIARLDAWIAPASWCSLTQFWGHLDAAAVRKLPATIKSLGLVLRDQEDMAAVNALCGAAFGSEGPDGYKFCLNWRGWTDLNLSVAKTFKPDHWKLTWQRKETIVRDHRLGTSVFTDSRKIQPSVPLFGASTIISLPTALPALGVRLRLYLPQLVPGGRRWMADLFRVMKLTRGGDFSDPIPLLLPGASIDPDPLLGVLRDTGQRWEVHLPDSMPAQQVARKEVAERYMEYGHCVSWDL